ncbi:MAG: AAA family ATPase [Planctomycetaceae bacterium]
MRLTEIDIDRFRIWRSLLLRLDPKGLNVIYGPNEAGKTTLMRFIRSTLYGYEPLSTEPAWHRPDAEQPWRGALRCEHGGRTWRIHRRAEFEGRGKLRLSGGPEGIDKEQAVSNLLSGTSEEVYTDIFAVGVSENCSSWLRSVRIRSPNISTDCLWGIRDGRFWMRWAMFVNVRL